MKKNQKGFVLAETLVVTVFLVVMFTMIYSNFLPLVGEYERREEYDTLDGKYTMFWLKNMIESDTYNLDSIKTQGNINFINFDQFGYHRFNCNDFTNNTSKEECKVIVKDLQINGCDENGNDCDIFISSYRLSKNSKEEGCDDILGITNYENNACFKETVKINENGIFSTGFQDYIASLPDYQKNSSTNARFRVTAIIHHIKDDNDYYSYATMEVNKEI